MTEPSEANKNFDSKSRTPIQERVLATLKKAERLGVIPTSPALPSIYEGAIRVLSDTSNLDRFSQAAHSLRELISILTRDKQKKKNCPECGAIIIDEKCDKCGMPRKVNHRQKVESLIKNLDPQGELNNFNPDLAGMLLNIYDSLLKWTHHGSIDESTFPFKEIGELEQILLGMFAFYFDNKTEIKSLIDKPSQVNYEKIKPKIFAIRQNADFFFTNADPGWFDVLKSNKVFDNLPGAKQEDGLIKPMPWPQSKFLKKAVNTKPNEIADIIYDNKNTDNWIIIDDFAEAAIELDPNHSAALQKIASACKEGKWLEGIRSFLMPRTIAKLALKLLSIDQGAAFALLSYIIDPILKDKIKTPSGFELIEAKPKFENYEYEDILKELIPKFTAANPVETLKKLVAALSEALKIEMHDKDDYSDSWRKTIFRSDKQYFELKNELVSQIIEIVPEAFKKDEKTTTELLKSWGSSYSIFKRIGIFTAAKQKSEELTRCYLLDKKLYFQYRFSGEMRYLLSRSYKTLNSSDKSTVNSIIAKGPNTADFIDRYKTDNGNPPEEAEIQKYAESRKEPYLKSLSSEISETVLEMEESRAITSWIGPTSPIAEEELSSKSDKELITYLSTWKPSEDHFSPSRDGLSSILKESVKKNPERFISLFGRVVEEVKKPEYIYGIIRGICETDEEKLKKLDWCVFLSKLEIAVNKKYLFEGDEEWSGSALKAICDVLEAGLNKNLIPLSQNDITWKIIEKLTKHSDPSASEEKQAKGKSSRDLVMTAINSVRSKAYEVAILHGLWLARMTKGKTKMTLQLRELLENGVDGRKEKSPSVKTIYSMRLPNLSYLNKDWVISNLNKIIPEGEDFVDLFGSFALYGQYSDELYHLMRPKFQLYLEKYASKESKTDLTHRVTDYIMIAYLRGLETLENDSLVSKLFLIDDPDISSNAMEFIGRDIDELNQKEHAEIIKRARQVWDWSNDKTSKGQLKKSGKEISLQFGVWFKNNAMDKKWLIENLEKSLTVSGGLLDDSYQILLRLMEFPEEYPLEVIRCLILLAKAPLTPRFISIFYDKEEFYSLLDLLKDTGHQEEFGYLIDTLGKCGLEGVEAYATKTAVEPESK